MLHKSVRITACEIMKITKRYIKQSKIVQCTKIQTRRTQSKSHLIIRLCHLKTNAHFYQTSDDIHPHQISIFIGSEKSIPSVEHNAEICKVTLPHFTLRRCLEMDFPKPVKRLIKKRTRQFQSSLKSILSFLNLFLIN